MFIGFFFGIHAVFWLGLMLIIIFALNLDILPATGNEIGKTSYCPRLPWLYVIAVISRMTRVTMMEVLHMDYIRTARAKGATEGVLSKTCHPKYAYSGCDRTGCELGNHAGGNSPHRAGFWNGWDWHINDQCDPYKRHSPGHGFCYVPGFVFQHHQFIGRYFLRIY
jgi:hypothetical protein